MGILPIPLAETLYAQSSWGFNNKKGGSKNTDKLIHDRGFHGWSEIIVQSLMVMYLLHLYLVTFLNLYATSAFFHTGGENIAGFILSLIVQVPMYYLQCTTEKKYFQQWGKIFFPQATKTITISQGNGYAETKEK